MDMADVDSRIEAHAPTIPSREGEAGALRRSRSQHPWSYGPHGVDPLNAASANIPSASSTALILVIQNTSFR
jgi:hypothetical protein